MFELLNEQIMSDKSDFDKATMSDTETVFWKNKFKYDITVEDNFFLVKCIDYSPIIDREDFIVSFNHEEINFCVYLNDKKDRAVIEVITESCNEQFKGLSTIYLEQYFFNQLMIVISNAFELENV